MQDVIIVSGGMDSVTLLHYLVKMKDVKPYVLIFDYGQKHVREVGRAVYQATSLHLDFEVMKFPIVFGTGSGHYVPNRNMIFLSLAVAVAENIGADKVYCGAQAHSNQIWDTTSEFMKRMNHVLELNDRVRVQLVAPFEFMSKLNILNLGVQMGVDYAMTWSCYAGRELACGVCPVCVDRLEAFRELGIPDPLPYAQPLLKGTV